MVRNAGVAASSVDGGPNSPRHHWSDCAIYNAPAYEPGPCNCGGRGPTVAEAEDAISALSGDAAKVARLIAACVNAEAAFHMLGCHAPKRRTGFLPVGVQTLVQIEDLLATMPAETALVRASMAFACDICGMPAISGNDDCWVCDRCLSASVDDGVEQRGSTSTLDDHPTRNIPQDEAGFLNDLEEVAAWGQQ